MGLYDGTGALDANAKALATEALILEQTAKYAGDFTDTQDGLANSTRTLQAQTENLAAAFGEALLPVAEKLIALLSVLVGWIAENQGAFEAIIAVIASVTAAILALNVGMKAYDTVSRAANAANKVLNSSFVKYTATIAKNTAAWVANKAAMVAQKAITLGIKAATAAYTAVQWALNAALTANPIGLIVAAIGALIAAVVLAYQKSDKFREIVDKLWQLLKNSVIRAFEGTSRAIEKLVGWFKKAWDYADRLIRKMKEIVTPKISFPSFPGFGRSAALAVAGPTVASSSRAVTGANGTVYNITVQGAIDPVGTAETIRKLLNRQDIRSGRPVSTVWQAT
jgi:hypothetical protein